MRNRTKVKGATASAMPARNMSKFLQQLIQRKYQYNDVRQGPEEKKKRSIPVFVMVTDMKRPIDSAQKVVSSRVARKRRNFHGSDCRPAIQ
jgi:hypothetical protein